MKKVFVVVFVLVLLFLVSCSQNPIPSSTIEDNHSVGCVGDICSTEKNITINLDDCYNITDPENQGDCVADMLYRQMIWSCALKQVLWKASVLSQ